MKRRLTVLGALFILFTALFLIKDSGKTEKDKSYTEITSQEAAQNKNVKVKQESISNSELTNLVNRFVFPPMSTDKLNYDEEYQGLPLELINQVKEAVYNGTSDSLMEELNNKELMINVEDFEYEPNTRDDIDRSEKDLNEAIKSGASNFFIYRGDTNGDGTDEIIMIQNLKYEYSYSNLAYILKKEGDKYVYAGYDYLGYYRCFAIHKYEDKLYLIANYDDYMTKTTKAVGVFALDGDNNGFMWLSDNKYTYLRKTSDSYQYNLLYKNEYAPIANDIQTYINEVKIDLIFTDRTHETFYGNETERKDLLEEARSNNDELSFWNINTIDVNNDGNDDFFNRKILYNGSGMNETEINWYNPETGSITPAPFKEWKPSEYFLTQQWFQVIKGKTIIFSLYHKDSEDIYLLDARINEKGQTTILLDYIINMETNVELSDYWDYEDSNYVDIAYHDSDIEKAFPDDIDKRINSLAEKIQGDFVPVNYEQKDIPNELIVLAQKALFEGDRNQLDLNTDSFEASKDDFYEMYGHYTLYDNKEDFEYYVSHLYTYKLEGDTYYILVSDSGGSAKLVDINILKESNGELILMNGWTSLDIDAKVIKYNDDLYFIESSYNYYSKYTDTINIYKLVPEKIKDYVTIELKPNQFAWEEIFNNHQSYEKSVSSYVESIKIDLMNKSPINDNIQIYMGDETNSYNKEKQLRLKSVGGYDEYYEIDFNNDGAPEYLEKHFWFPSNYTTLYLINNFYRFSDERITTINSGFDTTNSTLIQLWFKEIEGKVFAFRLFLLDEYNYLLNVTIIENTDITQVQSYLIVPQKEYIIRTQECEED